MTEKVTIMVLKVDLQCPCCYKKVKKTLCKFPQIRDQVYDEKANTVTIKVVCCSPEKIRDKLCCKGAKAIKSIEIKESSKPKEPEKPKDAGKPKEPEKPKEPAKPKEPEKPKVVVIEKPKEPEKPKVVVIEKPKEAEKPKEPQKPKVVSFEEPKKPEKPKSNGNGDKPKSNGAPPPAQKLAEKPNEGPKPGPQKMPDPAQNQPKMAEPAPLINPPKMPEPAPVQGFPSIFPPPPCYGPYYEGYGGMPCYQGYAIPPPQQPMYDNNYYGHGYGHERGYHVTRCDYYLNDDNPQSCSIM